MKKYRYPSSGGLERQMNTRTGIAKLANGSMLECLLRELDGDGSEVGGAMLELNALVNYVTQTEKLRKEIYTHCEFITHKLNQ